MNNKRWQELERKGEGLTKEEISEGWHWCPEWDDMLIGPEMHMEWEICNCEVKNEDHDQKAG